MKLSNNTLLIGALVLSIGFVMSSKMEMNNQSILSLILIGVSIMCIVKGNRNNMNGEVCFLVAIYLLSNLLSKYFGNIEHYADSVTPTYDVLTKEQIIQKLKEDNFSGKKRLEFTDQGYEADSISKNNYIDFDKNTKGIFEEIFGSVAWEFYLNRPIEGSPPGINPWKIQRTNLVNENGKNKSTYNIYEPYPGTTLEEMKKILEEYKNDKYPISNIKIIEDGEVNIAKSNENNNKKLKVKFSYYTPSTYDEEIFKTKPHIKVPSYHYVWRNSENYLAEEITDENIILIIKWTLLFVSQVIGVKLKNIHLLGIDHKSTDKNFSVIIEGEDQSKINYIIDTLKILNDENDILKEYSGIEIKDIENDIKQVDEIPGAITLNLNTSNTNKDEIKELISKTFSIDKSRISVKFNESFESSTSSVTVQIFPELNDPETLANLEQLAQQKQSELESILGSAPVETPGLNPAQIAGISSGAVGAFLLGTFGVTYALNPKFRTIIKGMFTRNK